MGVHALALITFPFLLSFRLHLPAPDFNTPLHLCFYLLFPSLPFILIDSVIIFYPLVIASVCPLCC